MRAFVMLVGASICLSGCQIRTPQTQDNDATVQANDADQPVAPKPKGPPTEDEKSAYNEARVQITMMMTQCKVAKKRVDDSLQTGNQNTIYSAAHDASDICENSSYAISQVDFSKINNEAVASDLKAADDQCGLFAYTLEKAFLIIANAANEGGPLHPADVDEVQTRNRDAQGYDKKCASGLNAIGAKAGLDDTAKHDGNAGDKDVAPVKSESIAIDCESPPFGSTDEAFQGFARNMNRYVVPTDFLSKICKAKYNQGISRKGLYNMGITDSQIDGEDTVALGLDMMEATRKWTQQVCHGDPNCFNH